MTVVFSFFVLPVAVRLLTTVVFLSAHCAHQHKHTSICYIPDSSTASHHRPLHVEPRACALSFSAAAVITGVI